MNFISRFPEGARLRIEVTPHVRVHPSGSHVIVYEVRDAEALILRIRQAAEDWSNDPL